MIILLSKEDDNSQPLKIDYKTRVVDVNVDNLTLDLLVDCYIKDEK